MFAEEDGPRRAVAAPAPPAAGEVRAELARILSSRDFVNAHRLSRFLRFVAEHCLERPEERLGEFTLGTLVFDRGREFDPAVDTIVRVEASRLRARLRHYYRTEGRGDPILIQLKAGGYAAAFSRRTAGPRRERPAGTRKPPAVAVLPFQNLNQDPEQEYLCEGIAEELIRALSSVESLRVIAWNSTKKLKGASAGIRAVGAQLKVGAVLEGSVRRVGDRLRISAQLVDTVDCFCLWSEVFSSDIGEVATIQERISRAIIQALPMERIGQTPGIAPVELPSAPELYTLYLKARFHLNRRGAEGLNKALEYFESLLEQQPEDARAHAGRAEAFALMAWHGFAPPNRVMPKAKMAALRAVKIDPRLAEAHRASGLVSELYDWDWPNARASLRLAADLSPGSATTLFEYGFLLSRLGELDESFAAMRRAQELDPLSPVINTNLGVSYYYQRRCDRAIRQFHEALELDPAYQPAYYRLALAHLLAGAAAEAVDVLERAMRLPGASPRLQALWGYAMAQAGSKEAAGRVREELLALAQTRYISPVSIALLAMAAEGPNAALIWLERAQEEHDALLVDLLVDPLYDALRGFRRFGRLLANMNLEPIVE